MDSALRYSRQIPVLGEEGQRLLGSAKVGMAGLGGLGGNALTQLALAGVRSFVLVDNQCPDESNMNRQFIHFHALPGESKASSAARWVSLINPEASCTVVEKDVASSDAVDALGQCDLILDCLDSYRSRMDLNAVSLGKGIPMVHAAVEECRGQVTFIRPGRTACLRCFLPRGEGGSKPVLGAAAGAIASIQATEAVKYLVNRGSLLEGTLLVLDLMSNSYDLVPMSWREGCPDCGAFRKRAP